FPLLHIDTTWKFREMIAFRDQTAAQLGMDLLVHINHEGLSRGISPFGSGSALYTQVMKTEALRQALDKWKFDAAFAGARRDEERLSLLPGENPRMERVRFRTLGCYPLTGAVRSNAATTADVIAETRASRWSERQGRLIDHDQSGSMELKKREGYF